MDNMDNGRSGQLIEKLIDMLENGQSVPLSPGKVAVNKDEAVLMLRELENIVAGELKVYREITDKKGRIITDAKKEAEDIVAEAEQSASRIRVTKRISSVGSAIDREKLTPEDKMALRTANDIYAASLIYTDEMLTEVTDVVDQAYDLIYGQYQEMLRVLDEKTELIKNNKAELMSSLKELDKDERYTQILELGQLLSNELYSERMRVKELEGSREAEKEKAQEQPEGQE